MSLIRKKENQNVVSAISIIHTLQENPRDKMAISKCHLWMTLQSVTLMTLLFDAKIAVGDVVVTNLDFNVTIARFHSASAAFGERLPDDGLKGAAIRAVPEDGCRVIAPPPSTPQNV